MADPLSTSASVAGLLGLAITLSQVSYQYVASVKGSSKAWLSYMEELSALTSVLLRLQAAGDAQERYLLLTMREPEVSDAAISNCISELQQLKTKLDHKLSRGGALGKLAALAWPFSEADTLRKVEMLHRYHDIFSSALLADNYTVSIANYRELREQGRDNTFRQILEWFRPRRKPRPIGDASEQLCPGTGSALLGHQEYLSWRDGTSDCLWLFGEPGVGKTVLSAAVVGDLRKSVPASCIIAYHLFHSFRLEHPGHGQAERNEECLQDLLCHLIFQSMGQSGKVVPEATELFNTRKSPDHDLSPKDLASVLTAISKACRAMYIVLDALDECQYLAKLARYLPTMLRSGMRFLLTSRDIPDVRKHLEGYSHIEVKPDRNDILHYVDWRLRDGEEVEYDLLDDTLKQEIGSKLFEHAGDSFLLVQLLMDHITSLTTIKKIRKCLDALPADYNKAYQSTFDRILQQNDARREVALKTLTWVSNVKQPLTMRQLQHAIAAWDCEDAIDNEDLESPKTILSSCLGLLRLSKTEQRVEFIHSSARSFTLAKVGLEAEKTISLACLRYMMTPEMASGPCSSLASFASRLDSLPFLGYAARFYGYHVRSVERTVVAELKRFLDDDRFRESSWQILHFVSEPSHILGPEIFAGLSRNVSILHVASYWGFSDLLATVLEDGFPTRAATLADIDTGESHGWTPLHWAASMGQVESAKLLLDAGATVDSSDSASWTPLFWAAVKGHVEMTTLLLSRGANIYHVDSDGMMPAHWAVSVGQSSTAEVLFGCMEKADVWDPHRRNELRFQKEQDISIADAKRMAAPYSTWKSLIGLSAEALDTGEFASFMRSVERTASRTGFYDAGGAETAPSIDPFFRTLWKVRSKGDWLYWLRQSEKAPLTAFRRKLLERAIETEQASLVKALLRLDANSKPDLGRAVTYSGDAFLHRACTRRNPELATALIGQGADPNQADRSGRTPLHHACQSGSIAVVNALLGVNGLNIMSEDDKGETPLMTLLREGAWRTEHRPGENLAIFKALVGHGASLYDVAIHLWDPAVISMLADSGVGFSNAGRTALHIAATAPFDVSTRDDYWNRDTSGGPDKYRMPSSAIEDTVDLLLKLIKHAEWEQGDSSPETPLASAICSENWVLARRLHELGAAFRTNRPIYPMILQATRAGIPELVQLLIGTGVDINPAPKQAKGGLVDSDSSLLCEAVRLANPRDIRGRSYTPNHLAIGDYLSVIRILVCAGVEVERVDDNGNNALELAVTTAAPTPILQALLDAGSNPYIPASNGLDYVQLALLNISPNNLNCLSEYNRAHAAPSSHWLHEFHGISDLGGQAGTSHHFVTALKQACAIDARDKHGHTLLFNAAMGGNQALVKELIAHGANVNDADQVGWTPLHAAVSRGGVEVVEFLLRCGADIKTAVKSEAPWDADWSPRQDYSNIAINTLHLALLSHLRTAHPRPLQLLRLLLDNGADPSETAVLRTYTARQAVSTPIELTFGFTPTTHYIRGGEHLRNALEMADLLVQRGAAVGDVALKLTLEQIAQFEGHEDLWEALRQSLKNSKGSGVDE